MAGIIHKIEEKLGLGGGHKEEEKKAEHSYAEQIKPDHHGEKKAEHGYGGEKKPEEHKEGLIEKIKDKIHGGDEGECKGDKKDKKKKKDKKEKKKHCDGDGEDKHGGSSSDSGSDSD
ncbi:hypothetical protein ABFS83_10G073400 [Erythranthe nasuta]